MAVAVKKRIPDKPKAMITFDVGILNVFMKYCLCDFVTKSQIQTLYKLMKEIDPEAYNTDNDIRDRIIIVKNMTEAMVERNIKDLDLLKTYVATKSGDSAIVLGKVSLDRNLISLSDANAVAQMIDDRLQTIYIYQAKQPIIDDLIALESIRCVSYTEVIARLKTNLAALLGNLMSTEHGTNMLRSFGFSDANYEDNIDKIVKHAKRPTSILQTGIRMLNAILSPGFQSGRFYCFLGCTGKFKSGTLLNIADQIRLYNPQVKAVEDGLRKTILFVTLENSINETVERLVDMYSGEDADILEMSTEDVLRILHEQGRFVFTDTDGIDIEIRYFGNLEIKVADLRSVVNEMRENGKEVIALILDYIARIESNQPNGGDERLRISYVSKNLKSLAQELNIPIITAMQVNRDGNAVLDAAMRENKQDLAQLIGASAVGLSWSLMEEADWVCFVYPERQISTGRLFLSFKRLKIRGKKYRKQAKAIMSEVRSDYFNHPFTNAKEIMLQVDVDRDLPVSIISLKTDLMNDDANAIEEERKYKENAPYIRFQMIKGGLMQDNNPATNIPSNDTSTLHTSGLLDIVGKATGNVPVKLAGKQTA